MTEKEFIGLLKLVPRSYPAFVDGMLALALEFEIIDEVANYMKDNPDAPAGEVSDFAVMLSGIEN